MMVARNNVSLAPSIKILIEETADVLERIGTIPSHRKGTSALYGRHLREVVRNTTGSADEQSASVVMTSQQNSFLGQRHNGSINGQNEMAQAGLLSFEPLLFSAMSDDQIVEAINNAGEGLDTWLVPNFVGEDNTGLDWLDWFSTDFVG
jgi:hypothetical protein